MAKKAEPQGESAPMWIVSFADLVTLMMSFFVVLYALKQDGSPQNAAEATEVTAAIKHQFGYQPPINSDDPVDLAVYRLMGKPRPPMSENLGRSSTPQDAPDGLNPNVTTIRDGKQITSGGLITFAAGSAELSPADDKLIAKIAAMLRGHNNVLFVKGHTSADEAALHPEDVNGMSLSYRRAQVVAEALVKAGIDRRVLRPVACGPFEPLKVGVYDEAGHRFNRRVEVFATQSVESEYDPTTYIQAPQTQAAPDAAPAAPQMPSTTQPAAP